MQITRLRLHGFKSFVDPADLLIESGLTGVVGPNGCGKSNLLEALRWVMGEASHKNMRASSMDDVIFAGTAGRPARNSAEVTIFIDNSRRRAPAEFNNHDVLEITRRIEREAGSVYRFNGREVRARDIKILFEDAATGARSPALVRQGQISEIVNARPEQRRRILEDAAGTAGLYSRRHEAELRLRAAEANLARLNDILGQLNSQAESLKRQARAARRYKEIAAEARRQEALVLHLQWLAAVAGVEAGEASLVEVLAKAGAASEAEARAAAAETAAAADISPLREEEARRKAHLAALAAEQDRLDEEAAQAAARQRELAGRAAQLAADRDRERSLSVEARGTLARLEAEISQLTEAAAGAGAAEEEARVAAAALESELAAAEKALADLTHDLAGLRARRASEDAAREERRRTAAAKERRLAETAAHLAALAARAPEKDRLAAAAAAEAKLAAEVPALEDAMTRAEAARLAAAAEAKDKRAEAAERKLEARALEKERETLSALLAKSARQSYPPVIDRVRVQPGFEAALAAALGSDLEAALAPEAPLHWRLISGCGEAPGLPSEARPLPSFVEGPPELARRLAQVGVVAQADGLRLQAELKEGQRLVSREGGLWRWDGFVSAAGAESAAARRLALKNQLEDVASREERVKAEAAALEAALLPAAEAERQTEAEERRVRQLWRETHSALAAARQTLAALEHTAREWESRYAAAAEARNTAEADLAAAREALAAAEATAAATPGLEEAEARLAAARTEANRLRAAPAEARGALAALVREGKSRAERLAAAGTEHEQWCGREAGARRQIGVLETRLAETEAELAAVAEAPARIAERRQGLAAGMSRAGEEARAAAEALAAAEAAHRQAVQALRSAQLDVAAGREARARIETRLEAARARRQDVARLIRETLDVMPEGCLALAGLAPGTVLPSLAEAESRLVKLRADRERLGGVNLEADSELERLGLEISGINAERADVEQAVAKLRSGISQLNREGKSRLDAAFRTVDGHFRRLFTALFNGGEARLEMIEGEDPLEGGLEIVARPPGKKPATLSLLSGGEQTLTALALIFAVFLTNPSPICVLDEVDAPLDDANVDRYCTLMERMAAETETRFLVITHHPMTMARMNRLFGVTMQEKGVSQLVSVDLEEAQHYREAG